MFLGKKLQIFDKEIVKYLETSVCKVNFWLIFLSFFWLNFNTKKWKQKNSGHFQLIDQMDGLVQMVYYLVVSHLYSPPTMFMGRWGMGNIKSTILDVRFNVGGANFGDGWGLLLIECKYLHKVCTLEAVWTNNHQHMGLVLWLSCGWTVLGSTLVTSTWDSCYKSIVDEPQLSEHVGFHLNNLPCKLE
jgi:hypothetical protein